MDPKTDYSVWQFWFDIGQYVIALFVACYIWLSNRDKVRAKDVADDRKVSSKNFNDVENRITKLETSAITHRDLGEVYERINELSDQVSNLAGKMDGVRGAVDMLQEYLLNNGGQ